MGIYACEIEQFARTTLSSEDLQIADLASAMQMKAACLASPE
jgi:hypothetical protein